MTVYVTQETTHDFTKAEQYGDIEFITKDDFSNVKNSLVNKSLIMEVNHRVKKFDPNEDWLIITGSPYVSAAVFMAIGRRGFQAVNVLRWDNRDATYRPITIDLNAARATID